MKRIPLVLVLSALLSTHGVAQQIVNDVTISVNYEQPVQSCALIKEFITLTNTDSYDYHDVWVKIPKNLGVCYKECEIFNWQHDPVTGDFLIAVGILPKSSVIIIPVTVQFTCELIPPNPLVDPATLTFEQLTLNEVIIVSHSTPADILEYQVTNTVNFPFLEYSIEDNINDIDSGNVGDIITRSVRFYNSGTVNLVNGAISFHDDHSNQIEVLNINVFVDGHFFYSQSGSDFAEFRIDLLESGKDITFQEEIKIISCPTPLVQSAFRITWGCENANFCDYNATGPFDLCLIRQSGDFSIARSGDRPKLSLSRVEPAGPVVIENTCYGGYTHYKYLIKNDTAEGSADMAYNVMVGIGHSPEIFTVMDESSIQITTFPADTADEIGYSVPSSGLFSPRYLSSYYADTTRKKPACLDQFQNPLEAIWYVFDTLKMGDQVYFEFDTYRCCPSDTFLFERNSPELKFNRWNINAYGLDECPPSNQITDRNIFVQGISGYNLSENPDGMLNSIFPNAFDVALKQHFEPDVTDLTGGVPSGLNDPAPWYGESWTFTVDNIQFMRTGVLSGDTNLVRASKAQIKIEIDLDKGLHILSNDQMDIGFVKGNSTWNAASIDNTQALNYGNSKLNLFFNLEDIPDTIPPITLEDARNFISGSSLQFKLTTYCDAAQPQAKYKMSFWLNPDTTSGCSTCWIALSQVRGKINVHCPGCITPGIIVDAFSMERKSYGFEDVNNNGKADGSQPVRINSNYSKFNELKLRRAVQGDTLKAHLQAHFEDGSVTLGVIYDTLKSRWATIYNNDPDKFEYLYLKQMIPHSNIDELNLVLQDSVEIQIIRNTGNFTFYLDASDTSEIVRYDNTYYYKLSRQKIGTMPGAPVNFEFLPWDNYLINSEFVVCGNFTPPDPINNPTEGARRISEIMNQMYFTGTRHEVQEEEELAVEVFGRTGELNSLSKNLFYLCEAFGGLFYFYSTETHKSFPFFNHAMRFCDYTLAYSLKSRYAGGENNIFPYEYRAPVSTISGFSFPMPDNTYGYFIDKIDMEGFGKYVSQTSGQYVDYRIVLNTPIPFDSLSTVNDFSFDTSYYRPLMELDQLQSVFNDKLLVGDEFFDQRINLVLKTLCSGNTYDSISLNSNATITHNSGGCTSVTISDTGDSLYAFQPLTPEITATISPLIKQATTQCNCWDISLNNVGSHLNYPYLYFPPVSVNSNFNEIYIASCSSGYCIGSNCDTINSFALIGSNGFYHIPGLFESGTSRKFRVCAKYNCSGIDSTFSLNFYYGGNCNFYPTDIDDPELCHKFPASMAIHENEAAIESDNSGNQQDYSYNRCNDEHEFTGCVKSIRAGGVNNFKVTITPPPEVIFDSSNVVLAYYNNSGIPSELLSSYSMPEVDSVTNQYIYDLALQNSGFGTDQVLGNNERLCFTFAYQTSCDYTGALPELMFEGITYCEEVVRASTIFAPWQYIPDTCSNVCGPNCSLEVKCESSGQQLYGLVTGAIGSVSYFWDASPPQFTPQTSNLTAGIYRLIVTDSVGCQASCMGEIFNCHGMRTQTQGGWGAIPNGGNSGTYLHAPDHFYNSFPAPHFLTIGCNNKIELTSPQDVTDFLPCSGSPGLLPAGILPNPGNTYNNTFAGQITALTISVKFDEDIPDFGASNSLLKNMTVNAGVFEGWTVSNVLEAANRKIGGCPSNYTVSSLNWTIDMINNNFVDGTHDNNFLDCGSGQGRETWENFNASFDESGMLAAYPTPFGDLLTIDFAIEHTEKVRIEILNTYGQVVEIPFEGTVEAGAINSISINEHSLINGVYFCRLISAQGKLQTRLVKMK